MASLPRLPLPQVDIDRVADVAKELTYVAVGFGVLGFQRAQVRRRELERTLGPLLSPFADTLADAFGCRRGEAQAK